MILAFTGAGISKASGINTFMEQPEIRDRLHRSFATQNPKAYCETISEMYYMIQKAEPNDAHFALAEYKIPIITMNIDGLHEKAGSTPIALHGTMPNESELAYADQLFNKPVLYGDPAPNYRRAYEKVDALREDDIFLVIGASRFTAVATDLREIAYANGAEIIEIQENAVEQVRETLESLKHD
ncbi:transcriptional regulator [Erysipelothrix piscisicarius]|uniref:protein acetyllysine N-acetyltransferase n=1 Tax=Erysipelothrix piscisicarius TaxID=2485784 RepID=A0A3S8RLD5_9FIRM|nr:Sir2 family NAD-dependent protein deacetylase [Erysipelothrix piscisicarius]AZK43693.1 transcriptional regulator [Erysipelothrix piscisicarius]